MKKIKDILLDEDNDTENLEKQLEDIDIKQFNEKNT